MGAGVQVSDHEAARSRYFAERVESIAADPPTKVVAAIPAGPNVEIRVELQRDDQGRPKVDVRAWRVVDGRLGPTTHGLTILRAQLPGVIAALEQALQLAQDEPTKGRKP